jgi:hypothetical protein
MIQTVLQTESMINHFPVAAFVIKMNAIKALVGRRRQNRTHQSLLMPRLCLRISVPSARASH